jgi:hypothetical protein
MSKMAADYGMSKVEQVYSIFNGSSDIAAYQSGSLAGEILMIGIGPVTTRAKVNPKIGINTSLEKLGPDELSLPITQNRGPIKLSPNQSAAGPHSTFRRDKSTGVITNYETYEKNPITDKFNAILRYRGVGKPHGGVNPPLILRPEAGKGIGSKPVEPYPAEPSEIPRGTNK